MAIIGNDCYDLDQEILLMATMNVSLPDRMKSWVEAQAATGRFSNASDYVRDLIRRDQERQEKVERMQRLVDEARARGISNDTMSDIRTRALRQAGIEA
jgi:antitoxin ParD1/3/4